MKKIAKILSAVLAIAMVISFAGCSNTTKTDADPNSVTWWLANNVPEFYKNYDELPAFQEIQKNLGIDIVFTHPSAEGAHEQFNIMTASGKFNDIVSYNWNAYAGGPTRAAKDGAIMVLNDYIEDKMPNFYNYMKDDPELDYAAHGYDGSISVIPAFAESVKPKACYGPTIRKDWLDKLGLEVPES